MKLGIVLGAALVFGPAIAVAEQQPSQQQQQQQPSTGQYQQPSSTQTGQQYQQQPSSTQAGQQQPSMQTGQQPSSMQGNTAQQDTTTQKLLPKDAKLVGAVESADIREFPEQRAAKAQKTGNVEKEDVVGVGALDRVWTTKQPYKQAVSQFDQKLKGEGIQPIAKTTTQSSTAWNVRMPDGHIANVVVRNTQPTTIEAVQASAMAGTITDQQQQQAPSSKSKTNDNMNQQQQR